MEIHLRQELERAALNIQTGNHCGAENIVRELQAIQDPHASGFLLNFLTSSAEGVVSDGMIYVHFTALRLLRAYITRDAHIRGAGAKSVLAAVTHYANVSAARFLTASWRCVLSETAINTALLIKLSCADVDGGFNASLSSAALSELLLELRGEGSGLPPVFINHVALHAIEEFGLYHPASRGRGVSLKFHRACRAAFETDCLAHLLHIFLHTIATGSTQSSLSAATLIECISSVLSWSHHSFFGEDSPDDECVHTYRVSGTLWNEMLLNGISFPGGLVRIDELLWQWYSKGQVCGVAVERRRIVEMIRQFCSILVEPCELTEKIKYGRNLLLLASVVSRDILTNATQNEDARPSLSIAVSCISNMVENLAEVFSDVEAADFLLLELKSLTKGMIELDIHYPDDENIMAALDEALSCLFKVTQTKFCSNSCTCAVVLDVINTFLSVKLSHSHSCDDAGHFSDVFASSHITLIAHMGRIDAERVADILCTTLRNLHEQHSSLLKGETGLRAMSVHENLWVVLKLTRAFIADDCAGEDMYIPSCFSALHLSDSHPVMKVIAQSMGLLQDITQHLSLASPAVVSALLELLGTFISVYVSCNVEEEKALSHGGATIVSCAFSALSAFNFDQDVTAAVCGVLGACLRSECLRISLHTSGILQTAESLVDARHQYCETVRGQIAAFWIACLPLEVVAAQAPHILSPFDIHTTEFTSLDVSMCLERCSSLTGLLLGLVGNARLTTCFATVVALSDRILSVSGTRFYEKELAIRSAELITQLFIAYAPILQGEQLAWLIERVVATLHVVSQALREDASWSTSAAEDEKQRMLKQLSSLLSEISQWRIMEPNLDQEMARSVGSCVISVLASLLCLFDERALGFPDLKDSVFQAFQLCAEAFTSEFVSFSNSQVFLSTLLFTLSSDAIDTQRVGATVTHVVGTFIQQLSTENSDLFHALLRTILQGILSGRLYHTLCPQLAQCLLVLCSCLPPERADRVLQEAAAQCTSAHLSVTLQLVITNALNCANCSGRERQTAFRNLLELVEESLFSAKSALLV
ncbi:hypothetical protein TRVL_04170 [Trypanosoma vivax]|nr:hypothetical protein TRVL_04170 [Trypanosoma vivax]